MTGKTINTAAYGTHLPVLVACVAHTPGSVLEMGCGLYSTPILHAICAGRRLLSVDNDAGWLARFEHLSCDWHELKAVSDWNAAPILDRRWDLVLVDHAPAKRRIVDIERLRPHVRLFVVHDTEHRTYRYERVLPAFRYRIDYKRYTPWTSVVSDVDDLEWLRPLL